MKVRWTEPAIDDLESIRTYIARDSELYATSFIEKILHAVDKLENFPKIGREVPEADDPNIRELIFQNYRIMYRITYESVQIITVIHGARDVNKLPVKPWEII
ncbi:type II toxin-antitoxin system RelE/ParE family toxin [candidate division KSB1 bacterium]|nr:type II toxin-antitoxin system RelE/ParE family toxin [candidate division KSB1 bacterium]MBL7094177.1 type II toxin-antitoxin system RelE/ParE family toxin [candidate division KSB1 bacterium]